MSTRKKIEIEYHIVGDGREFLNYWDFRHGDDVVAEIRDGELYHRQIDEKGEETEIQIPLSEFLKQVEKRVK